MRLFIAIQFNEQMLDALTKLQNDLRAMGVTGNYTKRENLHLTLAFIGEYGRPEDVLDAMEQADFRPCSVCLQGVGSFGDIFWAGIAENRDLELYARRLRRALAEQGIPFDRKKFSPHITLIRDARYKNGERIPAPALPECGMEVTGASLMKSERGRNGMVYTEVGSAISQ